MIFKTIEEASAMAEELRKDGYTVSIKERDEGNYSGYTVWARKEKNKYHLDNVDGERLWAFLNLPYEVRGRRFKVDIEETK